jgi:hypothetical protein
MDEFALAGLETRNVRANAKEAADQFIAGKVGAEKSFYIQRKLDTVLFLTGDGHFHATLSEVKGSGLRAIVWGVKPGRDLIDTADSVKELMEVMYSDLAG